MKRKIEINYNWDLSDYPDLDFETRSQLENHAEERISEMRKEHYTSGELHYENDKVSVSGWWSFSYTN